MHPTVNTAINMSPKGGKAMSPGEYVRAGEGGVGWGGTRSHSRSPLLSRQRYQHVVFAPTHPRTHAPAYLRTYAPTPIRCRAEIGVA